MQRIDVLLVVLALCSLWPPAAAKEADLAASWYDLGDVRALLIAPDKPAKTDRGKPWVWYAPAFDKRLPEQRERWMIDRLLAKGIAVAAVDVGESFGSPRGRAVFTKLYEHMVEQGYSKKPVLLARSRGGLMHYNWAVENPDNVNGVAGIYPVCNLLSYPGLKKAAPAYDMTEAELKDHLTEHNPVDRLAPLAKARVPIFHIHGDNDRVVPLEDNSALLATRYKKLGGPVTIEVIKEGGHDVKRHWFESQNLVDFMIDKSLQ
ncbi:MAG: prolyl oligopeptidase family serine peptidase [Planctomycetota bacterium]